MIENIVNPEKNFLRKQTLFTGLACLFISGFYFYPDWPFDRKIHLVTLLAAAMYFSFYLSFNFITKYHEIVIKALSFLGLILSGMLVHFSGGITSPFGFVFVALVFSEVLYVNERSFTMEFAIICYLIVVGGQCFGFLEVSNSFAEKIYSSGFVTFLICFVFIGALITAGYIGKLLTFKLKMDLQKEQEEKELAYKKYLELNSYSQLGFLSHRIAHDLRGHFFVLSSYFEMLPEGNKEENKDRKVVIQSLQRMKHMIGEVTKYGKPVTSEREKLSSVSFMDNMIAVVKLFEGAKEINFKINFQDNCDCCIFGSKQELQNAFFNIFKNAIEALEEIIDEKIIEINIKKINNKVQFIISDSGLGIDKVVLKNIFINPMTTKKDGTGIGLFIVRTAIENNNGTIDIKRGIENGTTVIATFPIYKG
jgi:signal transduction histidine kinase